ncbi:hypothetical protein F5141DRAFT_1207317 [Pisolithus sp. B1]|nr:hypothetical protein F5141DRAFT_1207317 [Pisolithus sp. B1]
MRVQCGYPWSWGWEYNETMQGMIICSSMQGVIVCRLAMLYRKIPGQRRGKVYQGRRPAPSFRLDEALESVQLDCTVWGRWKFGSEYGGGEEDGKYAGGGWTSSLDKENSEISKAYDGSKLCREEGRRILRSPSMNTTVRRVCVGRGRVDIPKAAIAIRIVAQPGSDWVALPLYDALSVEVWIEFIKQC